MFFSHLMFSDEKSYILFLVPVFAIVYLTHLKRLDLLRHLQINFHLAFHTNYNWISSHFRNAQCHIFILYILSCKTQKVLWKKRKNIYCYYYEKRKSVFPPNFWLNYYDFNYFDIIMIALSTHKYFDATQ